MELIWYFIIVLLGEQRGKKGLGLVSNKQPVQSSVGIFGAVEPGFLFPRPPPP